MRMIDGNALWDKVEAADWWDNRDRDTVERFVSNMPTIDPESLRPRGTWEGTAEGYADGELVYDTWTCSECGYTVDTDDPDDLTKFCPNCGAKMEGGHNP